MKRTLLIVAGALLALSVSPAWSRGYASSPTLAQQSQKETKTFGGKVMKNGDKFILSDEGSKTSYTLDNAKKVSEFEGKKVKVTGTVDTANNIIHVETIEEVA